MSELSGYDESEFERLYTKLLHQKIGAFFCVIADSVSVQREIAGNMCGRFPPGEVQVVDFGRMDSGFKFSFVALRGIINDAARFVFFVNFHLAGGDLSDVEFLQVLNLSRDNLAELPLVFVFMMPLYFRIKLARNAPDFNSFFRYRAHFSAEGASPVQMEKLSVSDEGFSLANKSLLEYYVEKYGQLLDCDGRQAFEIVLKILELNTSLRVLHFAELNRFFGEFIRLLPKYKSEFDDMAFEIARVFYNQGEYAKALEWYDNALAIREKTLGAEHPDTATTYNNTGSVYFQQGEYSKALELYDKALAIREKALGAEHPDTATTYNNIGSVYFQQGEYSKALELYDKALAICEKVLGLEHPSMAETYNNIALVHKAQGEYAKALEWYNKDLAISEKVLGLEHPDTAVTYNNIASLYEAQGEYGKALEWLYKDLAISEKVLGLEHPYTATTYNNIASVYYEQGEYEKALEWYKKAYRVQVEKLGEDHPNTKACFRDAQKAYINAGLSGGFDI